MNTIFYTKNKVIFEDCFKKHGINTALRKAHFIAQCHHESTGFTVFVENLNYSVDGLIKNFSRSRISLLDCNTYGRSSTQKAMQPMIANIIYGGKFGEINLGNNAPGDGWKYRGAGIIQLTGKSNQTRYFKSRNLPVKPELLQTPEYAIDSAGWFWNDKKLNFYADLDNLKSVRKVVNGGDKGLDKCFELLNFYKLFFNIKY